MSKAYDMRAGDCVTLENIATSTMPAYIIVKLVTTQDQCDLLGTKGDVPFGITQAPINPNDKGPVLPGCMGGISRLKMGSTAYTTITLDTTPLFIIGGATGLGVKATTSTLFAIAKPLSTWAASDIVAVQVIPPTEARGI